MLVFEYVNQLSQMRDTTISAPVGSEQGNTGPVNQTPPPRPAVAAVCKRLTVMKRKEVRKKKR
jgi:hypothetical protein